MGQICPVVLNLFWTLSPGFENNHTFKYWSGIFPKILRYMIMLENCLNSISVYGCSPIQGTKFYSCWNLMKPGSQSGTKDKNKGFGYPYQHAFFTKRSYTKYDKYLRTTNHSHPSVSSATLDAPQAEQRRASPGFRQYPSGNQQVTSGMPVAAFSDPVDILSRST